VETSIIPQTVLPKGGSLLSSANSPPPVAKTYSELNIKCNLKQTKIPCMFTSATP